MKLCFGDCADDPVELFEGEPGFAAQNNCYYYWRDEEGVPTISVIDYFLFCNRLECDYYNGSYCIYAI